ncbi:MAG: DUF3108 domain-containing protein [Geminicoccaceae bacterium]
MKPVWLMVSGLCAISPASAEERIPEPFRASASYEIRWSGLTVGEAEVMLEENAGASALTLQTASTGVLDWIVNYRSRIESRSTRLGERVLETRFRASRSLDGEAQDWTMLFGEKGELVEFDMPSAIADEHEEVPPHLARGPDPLALAATVMSELSPGRRLDATSFDGKRALALEMQCSDVEEEVAPLPERMPEPALVCELDGQLLAGASKRWAKERQEREQSGREDDEDRGVRIWLSDSLLPGRRLPVLAHGRSRWGTVVARLVAFSAERR